MKKNDDHNHVHEEGKEEFCALCVSSGLALVGAGGVYTATRQKGETKTKRHIALIVGIISIMLSLYFYRVYSKGCASGASSECSSG